MKRRLKQAKLLMDFYVIVNGKAERFIYAQEFLGKCERTADALLIVPRNARNDSKKKRDHSFFSVMWATKRMALHLNRMTWDNRKLTTGTGSSNNLKQREKEPSRTAYVLLYWGCMSTKTFWASLSKSSQTAHTLLRPSIMERPSVSKVVPKSYDYLSNFSCK